MSRKSIIEQPKKYHRTAVSPLCIPLLWYFFIIYFITKYITNNNNRACARKNAGTAENYSDVITHTQPPAFRIATSRTNQHNKLC